MNNTRELLSPSLAANHSPVSIYSLRTGFLAAFFGGPVAGAAVALVNAYRLKRLSTDWPIGLLALAINVALIWWSTRAGGRRWLEAVLGPGSLYYLTHFIGLAFFGAVYALHRTYYRGMSVLGIKPPNGWPIGLGALAVGIAVGAGLVTLLAP